MKNVGFLVPYCNIKLKGCQKTELCFVGFVKFCFLEHVT